MYTIINIQNIRDERDNFYVYIRRLNKSAEERKAIGTDELNAGNQ